MKRKAVLVDIVGQVRKEVKFEGKNCLKCRKGCLVKIAGVV